jgi:hypothetical protein
MAHLKITRRNVGFRYGTQPALLGLGVSSHDCIADGFPGVKVLYVVFGSRAPPNLVAQGHAVQERQNVYGGAHVVARPMRDLTDPAYVKRYAHRFVIKRSALGVQPVGSAVLPAWMPYRKPAPLKGWI